MDFSHPEWTCQRLPSDDKITTQLHPHQKMDLAWMIEREGSMYKKCRGGILGNDPGLGKTLTCISLIVTSVVRRTLIIVPANLIDNWIAEFNAHTTISSENIFVYYGNNRARVLAAIEQFRKAAIIITTYGALTAETETKMQKKEPVLLNLAFDRVILDEAHAIKNTKSQTFKMLKYINANNRWVISATPVLNYPKEIFSYLSFLNLDVREGNYNLKSSTDLGKLQKDIFPICMFRLKDQVLDLPKKQYENIFVQFSNEEQQFYDALKTYSTIRVQKLLRKYQSLNPSSEVGRRLRLKAYNSICVLILRLRQACDSPQLVMHTMERIAGKNMKEGIDILKFYSSDREFKEECHLCMNAIANVVSECGHRACEACWTTWDGPCPFCRHPVSKQTLRYCIPPQPRAPEAPVTFSSKADKFFREHLPYVLGRGEKAIVSSQFLKYLDYLKTRFKAEYPHLEYMTIDGSVSPRSRNQLLDKFRNDANCPICFISFTSSPEGLNIVQARWVFIFEKYWNSKKELQLIDRTHRIGQTKQVFVIHYFVQQTIEEKILALVNYKDDQIDMFLLNKEPQEAENWMNRTVRLLE